jgi:hypothetical protein
MNVEFRVDYLSDFFPSLAFKHFEKIIENLFPGNLQNNNLRSAVSPNGWAPCSVTRGYIKMGIVNLSITTADFEHCPCNEIKRPHLSVVRVPRNLQIYIM